MYRRSALSALGALTLSLALTLPALAGGWPSLWSTVMVASLATSNNTIAAATRSLRSRRSAGQM